MCTFFRYLYFNLEHYFEGKQKDFPHHKNDNLLCLFSLLCTNCQNKLLIGFYINVNDINRDELYSTVIRFDALHEIIILYNNFGGLLCMRDDASNVLTH